MPMPKLELKQRLITITSFASFARRHYSWRFAKVVIAVVISKASQIELGLINQTAVAIVVTVKSIAILQTDLYLDRHGYPFTVKLTTITAKLD